MENNSYSDMVMKYDATNEIILKPVNGSQDLVSDNCSKSKRIHFERNKDTVLAKSTKIVKHSLDDPPDGGWGWVVTFSAFNVGLILDGIAFSFGLFFKELYVYFNESKGLTSWIISVLIGTYLGIGPLASMLVSIFGCRKVALSGALMAAVAFFLCTWSPNVKVMILLYGLIGGAGLGLLYLPSLVTVGHYFKKRRALATGIAVCGSGIGGFVFAPLSDFLIEMYTWKGAMWVISAITLNGVVAALLLRPFEKTVNDKNYSKKDILEQKQGRSSGDFNYYGEVDKQTYCDMSNIFDFSLFRSPTFLVYGCSCFLCMLADRPWADALILNSVALLVGGVTTMFVPYYGSFSVMGTYCAVFGVAIAVFVSLRSIIMAELLGIEKLTSSFGLVTMCQGLSAFIGAPIAGALTDVTGNYKGAFYLAGAAICLSGLICFPLRRISKLETRQSFSPNTIDSSSDLTSCPKYILKITSL